MGGGRTSQPAAAPTTGAHLREAHLNVGFVRSLGVTAGIGVTNRPDGKVQPRLVIGGNHGKGVGATAGVQTVLFEDHAIPRTMRSNEMTGYRAKALVAGPAYVGGVAEPLHDPNAPVLKKFGGRGVSLGLGYHQIRKRANFLQVPLFFSVKSKARRLFDTGQKLVSRIEPLLSVSAPSAKQLDRAEKMIAKLERVQKDLSSIKSYWDFRLFMAVEEAVPWPSGGGGNDGGLLELFSGAPFSLLIR